MTKFQDPLVDGHEDQADSALPMLCPRCAELFQDCNCNCDFCGGTNRLVWTKDDAGTGYICQSCLEEIQAEADTTSKNIIFAANGVTLAIDGQRLAADLSYSDAVNWSWLLADHFPTAEITPVWATI